MPATSPPLPKLSAEQRRAALKQWERAKQVIKAGDLDYGIQLLLACCEIDPANLVYRQELRQTQRAKFKNSGAGQPLAHPWSLLTRVRLKKSMLAGKYTTALMQAEQILVRNPWDLQAHLTMAHAFEELEWP